MADGERVQLYQYFGGKAQMWDVIDRGGGFVSFKNVNSGKCLDNRFDAFNGGRVGQWSCDANNPAQQFTVSVNSDGTYRIDSRQSGLCVEVTGGSSGNGATVQQWNYVGVPNQKWTITKL